MISLNFFVEEVVAPPAPPSDSQSMQSRVPSSSPAPSPTRPSPPAPSYSATAPPIYPANSVPGPSSSRVTDCDVMSDYQDYVRDEDVPDYPPTPIESMTLEAVHEDLAREDGRDVVHEMVSQVNFNGGSEV